MAALNYLKAQGKIRAIGVSNFSRSQLEEASQYGRIESIQPPYSLFWRSVEKEIMPYCIENNISILAYSPLAQGLLTGKFRNGYQLAAEDHRIKNKLFHGENFPRVQAALNQLEPICMAEFWWGKSPNSEVRLHEQYYPACRGKCEPILAHMLEGISLEKNPMLEQATVKEIPVVYEDEYLYSSTNHPNFYPYQVKN
jgi:hypothetical protein